MTGNLVTIDSFEGLSLRSLRVRTHDQNFVPLIISNTILTLLQINVPPCQINVPPYQINDPPSQINVPMSNKFPKVLGQNHDPRDIYLQYLCPFLTMCTSPKEFF